MRRICPEPRHWHIVHKQLLEFARANNYPEPPIPFILAGWAFTNDAMKMHRWEETVAWADTHGCRGLTELPDESFYFSPEVSTYTVGPNGGPMYRDWDYEAKPIPDEQQLDGLLTQLKHNWSSIVGAELGDCTAPLRFTGDKSRRLVVEFLPNTTPPWGQWDSLSKVEHQRRSFTKFRSAINAVLKPHEVDHVDFLPMGNS